MHFCSSQSFHPPAQHQRLWRHHVPIGARVAGVHQNEPVQRKLCSRRDHDHGAGARLEARVSAHMAWVQRPQSVLNYVIVLHFIVTKRKSWAWTFVIQFVKAEILHSASPHVIPLIPYMFSTELIVWCTVTILIPIFFIISRIINTTPIIFIDSPLLAQPLYLFTVVWSF